MKLTLKVLADELKSGRIAPETKVLPRHTADESTGWLYREQTVRGRVVGEYADAGEYEVLTPEQYEALGEWLRLSVWPANHIIWKAEQDYLSGGA